MKIEMIIPILATLVTLVIIPVIYYYCDGMFEYIKGRNIFFKFGYLQKMLTDGVVQFWKRVFLGRDE